MNKYEIMFIVRPTLEDAAIIQVAEEVKTLLTKNGAKIENEKNMGQRELAYEIEKHTKGYYFLYNVEAPTNAISEFTRVTNVNEDIIRTLVIKIEE